MRRGALSRSPGGGDDRRLTSSRAPRRGDIWIVDFTPARGSEQAGERPALIVQSNKGNRNPRYPNTIVLAMTTKGREIPLHVRVEPSEQNGLRAVSWVKCEQILTIAKGRLQGETPLGTLTAREISQVDSALERSLGLPTS